MANDFYEFAKNSGSKVNNKIELYEEEDDRPRVMESAKMSGVEVIDSDEFHLLLHLVEWNSGSDFKLMITTAMPFSNDYD